MELTQFVQNTIQCIVKGMKDAELVEWEVKGFGKSSEKSDRQIMFNLAVIPDPNQEGVLLVYGPSEKYPPNVSFAVSIRG